MTFLEGGMIVETQVEAKISAYYCRGTEMYYLCEAETAEWARVGDYRPVLVYGSPKRRQNAEVHMSAMWARPGQGNGLSYLARFTDSAGDS